MAAERTPGVKLLFVGLIAMLLTLPLLLVYALVYDRQEQSRTAQQEITAGWGGNQVIAGPVIVIPYLRDEAQSETVAGKQVVRTVTVRDELFLSPATQSVTTALAPETRRKSIYASVIYKASVGGKARFELPAELNLPGVQRSQLLLSEAEIRFGVSDPRGLQNDATVMRDGAAMALQPGKGLAASGGSGFFGGFDWSGGQPFEIEWSYGLRGSRAIALVPRGGNTEWKVSSPWPHPGFGGAFLPASSSVKSEGFTATYGIPNLALGQAQLMTEDPGPPMDVEPGYDRMSQIVTDVGRGTGDSMAASIGLIDPVDLYSRVDRSVKYGFLFIGFTFLAFLLFDVVGGARVAAAEYLMTGAGLVLFFVLLLAFAEVIGFAAAYGVASLAIIGLLTAYSAAVLKSWKRARFIGALLVALYALIYVLLSLEAYSLLIGSVLLFFALAGVMYATRGIDWSNVGRIGEGETAA